MSSYYFSYLNFMGYFEWRTDNRELYTMKILLKCVVGVGGHKLNCSVYGLFQLLCRIMAQALTLKHMKELPLPGLLDG